MQADSGKLFIGGISWDTDEERLKEHFSRFGEVVEAMIMKDRATGRARGFGFVVFADPSVAERVAKEKHNIDGRMVEAKKAVPRDDHNILNRRSSSNIQGSPGAVRTRKIFVGGLASTVTENDFKKYFEQFGTITDVVVMYDHNTQRPRGFGFITYASVGAADKVLLKTFHELNGKMVEVKRAVPKELSPGPSRSLVGGYNYGLNRVNSFLNGYPQGYNPGTVGGYGLRMDGRFSQIASGRTGFAPFDSAYGMSVNFEPGLATGFVGAANSNPNVEYGQRSSPYYNVNANRFGTAIGYDGANGGNSSFFSSVTRNLWGNGGLNYNNTSNMSPGSYAGSGNGITLGGSFGNTRVNLSPSGISSGPGAGPNVPDNSVNFGYGGGETGLGYGRNSGMTKAPASSCSPTFGNNGGYDAAMAEFYDGDSVYGDPAWRPSESEQDGSGSYGYGFGGASSDVSAKSSPGYVGGYSVNKRLSNRGIAT